MLKKTLIGCMLILFIIVFSAQASEEVNYDFGRYGFDNTIGLDDYEYLGMVEDDKFIRISTGAAYGEKSLSDAPAVLAHEYGHGMLFANGVYWAEDHESRAVHEGYADVFGLCYDSFGWVVDAFGRDLADPESYGGVAHMAGYDPSIDCHRTGMILGHAAYLMWTGMDGFVLSGRKRPAP